MYTLSRTFTVGALLLALLILPACGDERSPTAEASESPTVSIERDVHFATADGQMVKVPAGTYTVASVDGGLRLESVSGGDGFTLPASKAAHDVTIEEAIAISVEGPSEDSHFVMLLLPNGETVEANGTYSGERSRGLLKRPVAQRVRQAASAAASKVTAVGAKVAAHKALVAAWGKDKGQFLRRRIEVALATMENRFDTTIGPMWDKVRNARGSGKPSAAETEALMKQALAAMRSMAAGTPGLRELLESKPGQAYLGGGRPAVLQDCKLLMATLAERGESIFENKIKPKLHDAMIEGFKTVAGKAIVKGVTSEDEDGILLTEDELKTVVTGMFTKYIVAQCQDGAKKLDALRGASDKQAALSKVETALARERRWEGAKDDFYFEILRAMGHKFIDSRKTGHGGYLIDRAFGMLHMSEGTVEKVASALAGLIPEVGAAICAALEVGIDAGWNLAFVPYLQRKATTALHDLLDQAVDQAQANILAKRPIASAIKNPMVRRFATTMHEIATEAAFARALEEHLAEIDGAVETFNASVIGVAKAAAGR